MQNRKPKVGEVWTDSVSVPDGDGLVEVLAVDADTVEYEPLLTVKEAMIKSTIRLADFVRWFGFVESEEQTSQDHQTGMLDARDNKEYTPTSIGYIQGYFRGKCLVACMEYADGLCREEPT